MRGQSKYITIAATITRAAITAQSRALNGLAMIRAISQHYYSAFVTIVIKYLSPFFTCDVSSVIV